jgi:hypothetical protein
MTSTVGRSDGREVQETIPDSKRTRNRLIDSGMEETRQRGQNHPEVFQSLRTVSPRYHIFGVLNEHEFNFSIN